MWVGMVQLVAMDMIFPTGSAKIGRMDAKIKKDTHTHMHARKSTQTTATFWQPHSLLLLKSCVSFLC